jgi:hypothetical protein
VRKEARSRLKTVKRKATKALHQTLVILFSQETWDLLINATAGRIQIVECHLAIPLQLSISAIFS